MKTELEQTCSKCGDRFWNRVGTKPGRTGALCPKCRTKKPADNKKSTDMLVVQAVRSQGQPDPRDEADVARELRTILDDAFRPSGDLPKGTFWERFTYTTPKDLAEAKRMAAFGAANKLVNREKATLRKLTELHAARAESEAVIVQSQNAVLEHRIEQARLRERLRREMQQALTGSLNEKPEEPEEPVEETGVDPEKDPDAWYAMQTLRRKARQRAMADQVVISEFLSKVRSVFDNRKVEQSEQALRIRSLMDAFARGPEDLPSNIRKFLADMESNGEN